MDNQELIILLDGSLVVDSKAETLHLIPERSYCSCPKGLIMVTQLIDGEWANDPNARCDDYGC